MSEEQFSADRELGMPIDAVLADGPEPKEQIIRIDLKRFFQFRAWSMWFDFNRGPQEWRRQAWFEQSFIEFWCHRLDVFFAAEPYLRFSGETFEHPDLEDGVPSGELEIARLERVNRMAVKTTEAECLYVVHDLILATTRQHLNFLFYADDLAVA